MWYKIQKVQETEMQVSLCLLIVILLSFLEEPLLPFLQIVPELYGMYQHTRCNLFLFVCFFYGIFFPIKEV